MSEFKIGDRVRVGVEDAEFLGRGKPTTGALGSITAKKEKHRYGEGLEIFSVYLDEPAMILHEWDYASSELELIND